MQRRLSTFLTILVVSKATLGGFLFGFWHNDGVKNAMIRTANLAQQTAFPPLECAIMPFGFTTQWGAAQSERDMARSFQEVPTSEYVPVPPYDLSVLQTPLSTLNRKTKTPQVIDSLTSKLFYSTRHFGAYDLDSGEFENINHPGIDLKMPEGTPVRSIAGGILHRIANDPQGLGTYVIVEHRLPGTGERVYSIYGHLKQALGATGDVVSPGQIIGIVGSSGNATAPHLHLQVDRGRGQKIHTPYYPASGTSIAEASRWTIHPIDFIEQY